MEEEKQQKELFEFEKPKRSFPKLSNFLPKADFERNILITLSLEKVIFISIGMMMLLVIVYAFGVEIGKTKASARIAQQAVVKKEAPAKLPLPAKTAPQVTQLSQVSRAQLRPSIIVAGAYSRKENAMAAMTRLRQAGHDAYIGQIQPRYQVWVGIKANSDAQKELARVKSLCRDAYLKPR